ncbi:MAG TPA: oxidoreductase, partial [Patescibacteria group bacterium]
MINLIDNFLNKITMYRLVLYFLIGLLFLSVIFSFFHFLPYDPIFIILESLFLFFFSGFINDLFSKIFKAPTNIESTYITALILALIITPAKSFDNYIFLAWAATLAMASKYILAINKKHIF